MPGSHGQTGLPFLLGHFEIAPQDLYDFLSQCGQ
jgi:hypothetical protein